MENQILLRQIKSLIAAGGLAVALLLFVSEINEHAFPTPLYSDYVTVSDSDSKEYKEQYKQYQETIKAPEHKRFYVRAGVGLLCLGAGLLATSGSVAIALTAAGVVLMPYALINHAAESLPIALRFFVILMALLLLVLFFYREAKRP